MKKLLYTLAGLGALALMASCNKEAERAASPEGEVVTATFTVAAPEGVATKAISDGATATELIVAVYDEAGNYLSELSANATKTGAAPIWNVSMKVIKDLTYQFVFIAKKEADVDAGFCHFDAANAKISIDYSAVAANSDDADFFFVQDKFKVTGSFEKAEEMHRPLAQVNFGASDLTAAGYSIKTDDTMLTGVTLADVYSEMNVLTEEESGAADAVTFTQAARVPAEDPKFVDGYDRIAMVYALVAKENQSNVTATLNVKAKSANAANTQEYPITREVANVPLKRNYRTNILGNVFTSDFTFTVQTVPGFAAVDYNKLIGPSFASVAALNTYFAKFTDNADNGDVNPEVVTLTAIEGTPGSIVLPDYAGRVQIRISASYGETLTLAYPDGATNKPAIVEIYAPSLSALSGEITSTHVTILGGSVINTTSLHTSDSTLEIQEGATVSTVNILKGNALIAGTVDKVDVQSGATADGENPVQVIVAKEAAIKQIELNAKSDVVVEQPKDNIDVATSDNKVVVTINAEAAGSSATAQNGGEIYVVANADCEVYASGADNQGNTSSAYVTTETDDVKVTSEETEGGSIVIDEESSIVDEKVIYYKYDSNKTEAGNWDALKALVESVTDAIIYVEEGVYFADARYKEIYINKNHKSRNISLIGEGDGPTFYTNGTSWSYARLFYIYGNYGDSADPTVINFENIKMTQPMMTDGNDYALFVRGNVNYTHAANITVNLKNMECSRAIIDNNYYDEDVITFNLEQSKIGKLVVDASPFNNNGHTTYSNVNYDESSEVEFVFQSGIDSGGFRNIKINGEGIVPSQNVLNTLLNTPADELTVALPAGEYTFPSTVKVSNLTVKGTSDTVIKLGAINSGKHITFSGVKIIPTTDDPLYSNFYLESERFENVTFYSTDGKVVQPYALETVIDGCSFTQTMFDKYALKCYGCPSTTIKNCSFFGNGKAMYIFRDVDGMDVRIENCTFTNNYEEGKQGDKSAIMVNAADHAGISYTVKITDCSAEGFYVSPVSNTCLWGIKNPSNTNIGLNATITVDGVTRSWVNGVEQ
ncbi:MAG: hypothetical protein IJ753_07345 [Bacteroidales bacterium]|nr:hypothetical protein [Bacteroidales bacterium]